LPNEKQSLEQRWNMRLLDILLGSSSIGNIERIARLLGVLELSDSKVPSTVRLHGKGVTYG
jgi:hypothetical protein